MQAPALTRRPPPRAGAALVALALAAGGVAAVAVPGARAAGGTARPPGLVQAGPSRSACLYVALGAPLAAAERATGITYRCLVVYLTGSATWTAWEAPWVVHAGSGYLAWVAGAPTRRTLVLTMNLVPSDVAATPGWRADGADGRFAGHARRLARNLVAAGLGDAVIRLGPEMNGPWEKDWVGPTAAQQRLWARFFARIVATMRSVPGAHFLFDWNANAGYEAIPLANYYPGDAAVDIVGIDAYDEAPIHLPRVGSPARWHALVTEPLGLDAVAAFAQAHHKPLSIPEWGTLSSSGDDGAYVAAMGRFVATHDVAYQAWYDAGNKHILELDPKVAPRSLAAYRSAFAHGP